MNSIRRQLLFWQIGALLVTGALASLITYSLAWDGFNRLRDYGLEQIAYSIIRHGVEPVDGNVDEAEPLDPGQFVSQIWNADGSLAYSSLENVGPPPQRPGMNIIRWQGEEWHIYTLKDGGLTIQVGNPVANRSRIFAGIVPWLLLPMSLLLVMLAAFIWISVGQALSPLERVRREIGAQDIDCLAPLDPHGLPDEVAPLIDTLNELLARLHGTLQAQRRFVADAAHELRTPLTAVRLQAQIAQKSSQESERAAALEQLTAGIDRAAHLVDQLLGMARLDPELQSKAFSPIRLDDLVKRVVGEFSGLADAKAIDLGVVDCPSVSVSGHAEGLRMMISNLVDNALRYTPTGGRVDVSLRLDSGQACLTITDSGPGIPAGERERVFDRFYRLSGAEIPGSGLGLAIVRQVVEQYRGQIELQDAPGGGLQVRVRLPADAH